MIFIYILLIFWVRSQFFTDIKNISTSIRCGINWKFWRIPVNIMLNNKIPSGFVLFTTIININNKYTTLPSIKEQVNKMVKSIEKN